MYPGSTNFYPRSPCGERHNADCNCRNAHPISIHALLAESDYDTSSLMQCQAKFLSTLSLRRATINPANQTNLPGNFYPRSPCGERPDCQRPYGHPTTYFYPRSPCGERPREREPALSQSSISIHALLAESDMVLWYIYWPYLYFYPRSPCGERLHAACFALPETLFLSTLSLRRATHPITILVRVVEISIHALLAESDANSQQEKNNGHEFLSTLSLRRATRIPHQPPSQNLDFYPRSPCGERPYTMTTTICTALFLSTLSLRRAT